MSATAVLPPYATTVMNGYGSRPGTAGSDYFSGDDRGSNSSQGGSQPWPHIDDLKAQAQRRVQPGLPLRSHIEKALQATAQADASLQFRRPEIAYVEYLYASEIALNVIPRHKDYPSLQTDRGSLHRMWRDLLKNVDIQHERFSKIKGIIVNQNRRDGVQPRHFIDTSRDDYRRASAPPAPQGEDAPYPASPRFSMPDAPTNAPNGPTRRPMNSAELHLDPPERDIPNGSPSRPAVRPKPEGMHGKAIQANGPPTTGASHADVLNERFARLRMNAPAVNTNARPPSQISVRSDTSAEMPSPSDYGSASTTSSGRPMGPRAMTNGTMPPPHPPKLPLDTQMSIAMPKAPSPTYSPARNMQTPTNVAPPRSSARSLAGTGGRTNAIASSASSYAPGASSDGEGYFPQVNGNRPTGAVRRKSVNVGKELSITAEKLYDYFQYYHVLLVDVRSRQDFDDGHVYTRSMICVEPIALRDNMSAEELRDTLVLSPDEEVAHFDRRDQFDLVVYYDQSTNNTSWLQRTNRNSNETALKQLFDALYEFNQEKPLQRPPILLLGGLDAWVDLLGQQALATSNTSAVVSHQRKQGASSGLRRAQHIATEQSRHPLPRKRTIREYNPLDPEEEKRWREKLRQDMEAVDQRPTIYEEVEDGSPINRTYEDFFRRFPEASPVDAQSMTFPASRPPIPKPPSYQPPPVPTAPQRPAPSVQRVNYSGAHEGEKRATASSTKSSGLAPYIPGAQSPRTMRLPKTGLINFGVTCYMNSTIQCLSATIPLTRIFLSDYYQKKMQRDNWKSSKGLMSEQYAVLLKNLWAGDVRACRPSSLRKLSARFNREWGIDRQQDAKEYFDFLIDFLHEDLNVNWSRPPLRALTEKDEAAREQLPKPFAARVEWGRYSHREQSLISDLFAGQHASRLRCTVCNFTSTTYEAFWSISLEIPRNRAADIRDCLDSYCAEELLTRDEVWKCPQCRKEREATKQITITRLPQFLVLHLKRFSASHSEKARKVRTPIEFPLNGLDLQPYTLPVITPSEEQSIMTKYEPSQVEDLKNDAAMRPPYLYNAYAVMRHIGQTLTSGHYIACVKDVSKGCWRQFNDERVNDFDPSQLRGQDRLQNDEAYIIFYERARDAA